MVVTTSEEQKKEHVRQYAEESPCICFNIRKAARAITQVYDDMFKLTGLRSSQISIIQTIERLGSLTVCQLADAMATDRTTITRNLKPLARDGYVMIQPGMDRREKEIITTKKAKEVARKAMNIWIKFQDRLHGNIGEERMKQLCRDLNEITNEIKKM